MSLTVRRFVRLSALSVAVVALAAAASAQEQGQQRRGFGGGRGGFGEMTKVMLLRAEPVQKELNLTDEQKTKVRELADSVRPQGNRESFQALQDLPEEERRAKFAEIREQMQKAAKEAEQKLETTLDVDQAKRLGEIHLQLQGVNALRSEELAAELKLTDDQKGKIREALEAGRQGGDREAFAGLRDLPEEERRAKFAEMREAAEKRRTEAETKALGVLTDEQKSEFERLKGEKISFDRNELFRGFGGGRQRDRNT